VQNAQKESEKSRCESLIAKARCEAPIAFWLYHARSRAEETSARLLCKPPRESGGGRGGACIPIVSNASGAIARQSVDWSVAQ